MKPTAHASLLCFMFFSFVPPAFSTPPLPPPTTWPTGGVPICVEPGDQRDPRMIGNGWAIVTWTDDRSGTGSDIYSQAFSANGRVGWGRSDSQGLPVSTAPGSQSSPVIASDFAGGAVIAWIDTREDGRRGDVYAQRILSTGTIAPNRPTDGVAISVGGAPKVGARIAADGLGGAYIAWWDSRNSALGQDWTIYVQHMLQDATLGDYWPANGLLVCPALGSQTQAAIVEDGAGGAIVAWEDRRSGSGSDIYAARILPSGALAPGWPDSGLAICTAPGDQSSPAMIPDGAGGALIAWADMRRGAEPDIYAQRVSASGAIAPGWHPDGVAVSVGSVIKRDPVLASDGAAGAVIAWWVNPGNGSNQTFAQRIAFDGNIAGGWPSNGLPLGRTSAGKLYPVIVGDGSGGAVVAWNDSSASDGAQVMAQRVAGTGAIPAGWNHDGVPLTNTSGPRLVTGIVSDGEGGGALVVWMDGRNGTDWDIYAQRVTGGGVVGPNYSPHGWPGWIVRSYPNPASQSLRMEVISMGVPAVVELFDVQGRLVRSQDYGVLPLGKLTLDVSVTGLTSGIYYVRYRDSKAGLSVGVTRAVVVR